MARTFLQRNLFKGGVNIGDQLKVALKTFTRMVGFQDVVPSDRSVDLLLSVLDTSNKLALVVWVQHMNRLFGGLEIKLSRNSVRVVCPMMHEDYRLPIGNLELDLSWPDGGRLDDIRVVLTAYDGALKKMLKMALAEWEKELHECEWQVYERTDEESPKLRVGFVLSIGKYLESME